MTMGRWWWEIEEEERPAEGWWGSEADLATVHLRTPLSFLDSKNDQSGRILFRGSFLLLG